MAKKAYEMRELPRKIRIFIILVVALFIVGIAGFVLLKGMSVEQAFSRTVDSLAFIFYEESGPTKAFEIFLSLFGVFLIWWVLWSFFDMLNEGKFGEYIKTRKFLNKVKRMENHYIIAGGGRVGEDVAIDLTKRGDKCVIIEKEANTASKLIKKGLMVIQGNAHDESLLRQAGIDKARAMIITLPDPEKALVATMIAKELNEKLEIFARCENPSFVSKLKKAGAKSVVVPEAVAADKIISELSGKQ